MKNIYLSLIMTSALTILGCGSSGSGDNSNTPPEDKPKTDNLVNKVDNINELKPYFSLAQKLVTGEQKTSCLPTKDGKSMVISQLTYGSTIQFDYTEYDNAQCMGDAATMLLSYYSLTLGDELDNGKAIEANLKFDHGENIVDKVPNHMLGYDISKTFYTTIVASGNEKTQEIKLGIAKPTHTNDGSTASKRANDVSDYTSGRYYFSN